MPSRRHLIDCASLSGLGLALALLTACDGSAGPVAAMAAPAQAALPRAQQAVRSPLKRGGASGTIQHVVIIMQENRSFDNLFNGYPGADTVPMGKIHTGAMVPLTPIAISAYAGGSHDAFAFLAAYDNGKMDGFDLNPQDPKPDLAPYTYVQHSDSQTYFNMAGQYMLADEFFTSHIDASFVAHQYIIAAQANHSVNLPWTNWGCYRDQNDWVPTLNKDRSIGTLESPCFDYNTLGDELDTAGLSWRFYAPYVVCPPSDPSCNTNGGIWSAYQAVNHIFNGPDWANDVISPETNVLTDVGNGTLANVTWVIPAYPNSDHPGNMSTSGPGWVSSVVNAIGQSKFWDSTVIFILWDEWGGEYDHVKPPKKDYDGDGFRVPLMCLSAYGKPGVVDHTQLEVGGILRYIENTFSLATMAAADSRATPAATSNCVNPSRHRRAFSPFTTKFGPAYFLHQRHFDVPPDDQ